MTIHNLYKSGHILQLQDIIQSTQCCISDLKDWMTNSKLQLDKDKTDMILILPRQVLNNASLPSEICLNGSNIKLSQTVCKLSITLDQTLSFQQHISNVCNTCYLEPGRISTIHHLSKGATNTLICAFILSRLDYCSALLSGSQKHLLDRLQKVQNNTAQLIYRSSKFSHVTPLLYTLHWLPNEKKEKRVSFKLASLCFKSVNGSATNHLSDLLHFYSPSWQLRSSADTQVFRIPSFRTKSSG